jgi:crotonobetainyl-CoA:carnitine CoA-transferase CaiB-like acyl-CoA transferase
MLEGVRIVDLTSVVFGPYATQMMADLGADVIKVEPPAGDQFRQAGRPAHTRLMGACHMTINRGKRSVVLDLKHPEDGAYAILAALVHRLRTGQGQFVEAPMFESFTHFMLEEHLFGAVFVPPTGKLGYPRQLDPMRQPFPTADGHISIVPYTDESVVQLMSLLGRPDVLAEPRLATPRERARNMALVYATIAELTPARTTAAWMVLLKEAQIPALPLRDLADMLDDPHLQATRFFDVKQHPSEGAYVEMRPPVRFGVDYQRRGGGAPLLGEHTESVREELKRRAT